MKKFVRTVVLKPWPNIKTALPYHSRNKNKAYVVTLLPVMLACVPAAHALTLQRVSSATQSINATKNGLSTLNSIKSESAI